MAFHSSEQSVEIEKTLEELKIRHTEQLQKVEKALEFIKKNPEIQILKELNLI